MKLLSTLRVAVSALIGLVPAACSGPELTPYDMKRAKEFMLSSLPALGADPTNRYGDDPGAAMLGEKLFFDTALSANSNVSCASCHQPDKAFQDGLPRGLGIGETPRRTMALRGAQWGDWFFWDGRKDSQWSQALEPLETPAEHGMTRDMVAREVVTRYRTDYEAVFGPVPDASDWPYLASPLLPGAPQENWEKASPAVQDAINLVFANTGKAIAAFQRTLLPEENRIDRFFAARLAGKEPAEGDRLTEDEIEGFKLFTGKARCDNCHSGPLYTDQFFHNTGVELGNREKPDYGRALAVLFLKQDLFSCAGPYSDAEPMQCRELRFMSDDPSVFEGAFKTPGLRGVSQRPPYMHAGQIKTLEEVVDHYVVRPDPFATLPELDGTISPHGVHTEVPEIELSEEEKRQLVAFLNAL
ncbi:cytochrome-c peroxidase [Salaquimonas pukyongi]|uniref:cytochrome-c peroxidase n=1 Tax=Salaquimonas pukyongi TaxID=2712698 RepID=UPI00096BA603|nr:cytochrome c peroxidase [Salaquimonas pukyongi]